MNIIERDQNGVTVFELDGRVDTQGAVDMDMALHAAVSAGQHKMVLDMAQVSYISSAGLGTLADVVTRNREAGDDLKLVGLNRKVLRVLRIIGLTGSLRFTTQSRRLPPLSDHLRLRSVRLILAGALTQL